MAEEGRESLREYTEEIVALQTGTTFSLERVSSAHVPDDADICYDDSHSMLERYGDNAGFYVATQ